MQIIPLICSCSVSTELLGARAFSLLSMDGELIVPIIANCGGAIGDIEPWCLRLRASDEGI